AGRGSKRRALIAARPIGGRPVSAAIAASRSIKLRQVLRLQPQEHPPRTPTYPSTWRKRSWPLGILLKENERRSRFFSQTYEVRPACSKASIPKRGRRSSIRYCAS